VARRRLHRATDRRPARRRPARSCVPGRDRAGKARPAHRHREGGAVSTRPLARMAGVVACVAALASGCTAWTWGYNRQSQLGDGTINNALTPIQVGAATWRTIGTGGLHTCGIRSDESLWCVGYNHYGQLGIGTTVDTPNPAHVGTSTWKQVAVA